MSIINEKDEQKQKRMMTVTVQHAMVRDLVSTMYAHTSEPRRQYCTMVARALVKKYPFMKDAGMSGYVSIIMCILQWALFYCTF